MLDFPLEYALVVFPGNQFSGEIIPALLFMLHPKPTAYPLIVICVLFSAGVVYLWEFVFIPYDPVRFLYRSVRAFYHNIGRGVAALRQELESRDGSSTDIKSLQRGFKPVHRNRGVIEGLFAASGSPSFRRYVLFCR